jgi:hypothetical protein
LPAGRSLFRDKRIPRENLSGLLIERRSIDAVLYSLTGLGGPWAQDPPYYASVLRFEARSTLDWSHTRLEDWSGWQQDRWIYFYHGGGPIIVVDSAVGPSGTHGAVAWQVTDAEAVSDRRLRIGATTEMLFVPLSPGGEAHQEGTEAGELEIDVTTSPAVLVKPRVGNQIRIATILLMEQWAGAEAHFDSTSGQLTISKGDQSLVVPTEINR